VSLSLRLGTSTWPVPAGAVAFHVPLDAPLSPGRHTASLEGDCLSGPSTVPRTFTVGILLYPNPVRAGANLVLENLPPDTQARLIDAGGRERKRWRVGGGLDRVALDGIGAGVYVLRLETPAGTSLGAERVIVLR
jgi:hypothetical protein